MVDNGGYLVRPKVVDAGYHTRRLLRLTGLDAEENQARRLLNDLDTYRAESDLTDEQQAAHRWLTEVFEPVVRAVPAHLRRKLEPQELFSQIIEHKWLLSERAVRGQPTVGTSTPSTACSSGRCTSTSERNDCTAGAIPTSRPARSESSHLCSMIWAKSSCGSSLRRRCAGTARTTGSKTSVSQRCAACCSSVRSLSAR